MVCVTDMVGDTMLVVTEIEDGVFRVELTDMHYDCLDKTSKTIDTISEAILAMWIGSGMVELAGFAYPESGHPLAHPDAKEPGDEDGS